MSRRKGISFTLTIVVAGVILLMTALSVITLGGSSISSFFGTAGEQQTEALIEQACNDKAREIQNTYCDQYIPSTEVVYEETGGDTDASSDCDNGQPDDPSGPEDCDGDGEDEIDNSDDIYTLQEVSNSCNAETNSNQQVPPRNAEQNDGQRLYDDGAGVSGWSAPTYYEQTASEAGCEWEGNAGSFAGGEIDPRVEVDGDTYNCLDQGHIQPTCPVQ